MDTYRWPRTTSRGRYYSQGYPPTGARTPRQWGFWVVAGLTLVACSIGGCSTEDPPENYLTAADRPGLDGTTGSGGHAGKMSAAQGGGAAQTAGGSAGSNGAAGESSASGSAGTGGNEGAPDCGPAPMTDLPFTKERLRAAAADCTVHHLCVFESYAQKLERSVARYAEDPSQGSLETARSDWKNAMSSWQQLELFQFGPLANPSPNAGKDTHQGQGIRDKIYAWPTTARCRVDQQVINRTFLELGLQGALISGRGLYALEVLLFHEGAESACAPSSPTARTWQSLDAGTLQAYKADYAVAVAEDVVEQVQSLLHTWSLEGGNFREAFVSASGYPSEQEAMNVLGWALVYIEKEVKDWKLGLPAGYTLTAPVGEPEAPHAGTGSSNIHNNLLGFRSLFQGCGPAGQGLGFDDWLQAAGHGELGLDIIAALENALSIVAELPPLTVASEAAIEQAYLAVKALTDLLKNELLGAGSPLNLDLPSTVEGDTD